MMRTSYFVLLLGWTAIATGRTAEFHVSTAGNDAAGLGTAYQPFATPARAMLAVRERVRAGLREDVRVILHAGVYELAEPLRFSSDDSGTAEHSITYAAAPGKTVVLSGGRAIRWMTGSEQGWFTQLPETPPPGSFRQLVVNDKRAVRARWPDQDGVLRVETVSADVKTFTFNQAFPAKDLLEQGAELVVYQNWSVSRALITGWDGRQLTTATPVGWIGHGDMTTTSPGKPAFIEHARAALDQPGEWFFERSAGRLHYLPRPGEIPGTSSVIMPRLTQLVTITGTRERPVRNLRFEGLRFEHTDFLLPASGYSEIQAAHYGPNTQEPTHVQPVSIECLYAEGVRFERCRFAHLNNSGIGFGAGCRSNAVVGCLIQDIGGTGVMVGWRGAGKLTPGTESNLDADWADPADIPAGNTVANCVIRRCGADSRGAVGVFVAFSTDTRVAHNLIHEMPYTGISVGYRWDTTPTSQARCRVEFNHIYDVMKTLADGGGVYTLGWQPGTVLRGNLIHDVHRSDYAHGGAPNNGFFVDEGSKGFLFESNVVYATSGDSVRFNQCERAWHTWTGNAFGPDATPERIREAASRAGLEPAYASTATAWSPPPHKDPYPLRVSENGRYLIDAAGAPFPVVGDTPWSLIAQLREPEIARYLDDRAQRGFNAIIVNLIEHKFATRAPSLIDGTPPFLAPGDFARPNPAYFVYARRAVEAARARGISVWLCPAYLGWGGKDEGFFQEINKAGPAALRAYGRFVGEQFKDLANVIWMPGGDYAMPETERWAGQELALGLREGGARQLMTAHGGQTSAVETFGNQPWLAIESVYEYDLDLWRPLRQAWQQQPVRPFVMIESAYEGEHQAAPDRIRRQAWWPMLCGAAGQFFGNNPIWYFDGPGYTDKKSAPTWQEALGLPGSRDIAQLASLLERYPWWQLVPDLEDRLIRVGGGQGAAKATAASTPDGRLTLVYVASDGQHARDLVLDLGRLPGPVQATWINPALDQPTRPVGRLENRANQPVRSPGDNGTGANDWLLALDRF